MAGPIPVARGASCCCVRAARPTGPSPIPRTAERSVAVATLLLAVAIPVSAQSDGTDRRHRDPGCGPRGPLPDDRVGAGRAEAGQPRRLPRARVPAHPCRRDPARSGGVHREPVERDASTRSATSSRPHQTASSSRPTFSRSPSRSTMSRARRQHRGSRSSASTATSGCSPRTPTSARSRRSPMQARRPSSEAGAQRDRRSAALDGSNLGRSGVPCRDRSRPMTRR